MTKQTYVKVGGVWKPCTSIWTKVGGVWKQNVTPKINVGGSYKECMQYGPVQDYSPVHGNEFIWNDLTYKVIVIDYGASGKLAWLDRNLGAARVATALNDSQSYGDLYQWGRLTDGHEKYPSSTTSTKSSTDVPGHGNFIASGSSDWRATENDNLWQGVDGVNNPCPPGWRIPTYAEFQLESNTWGSGGGYDSALKTPMAGYRSNSGIYRDMGGEGFYWLSNVSTYTSRSFYLWIEPAAQGYGAYYRSYGHSVRCVRSDVD